MVKMSEVEEELIGLMIGAALGVSVTQMPPSPSVYQDRHHHPPITKSLIPITWTGSGHNNTVRRADEDSLFVKKTGLEFVIRGHKFLGLLDSGMLAGGRVKINHQTANEIGIHNFHRSENKLLIRSAVKGNDGKREPIYEDVPLTIPGVSTVITDVEVGNNNLINPAVFLPNHDISFHGKKVTFMEKDSARIGTSIPYLKSTETTFNWNVGHHGHTLPILMDTGGDWSLINAKDAHDIGITNTNYEKIIRWDKVDDDFLHFYNVPVSLPGTAVQYMSKIQIQRFGRNIISGPELLDKGWGFTLRDESVDFYPVR
jgi:hypothetical protein